MADFDTACERMNFPLIVLPSARPKYSGGFEFGNRTFREELYTCRDLIADSIGDMRFELRKAVEKYNTFRPHHALKSKTPMEYLRNTQAEAEWVPKHMNLYTQNTEKPHHHIATAKVSRIEPGWKHLAIPAR